MDDQQVRPWKSLNWPNRISLGRLVLVAPFVVLLMNQGDWPWARWAALSIFTIMAISDLIDGLLARKLDQRTRLGAILDPLADKALIICAAVLLSLPGSAVPGAMIDNWVVVVIVAKDLWVIIGFIVIYLVTDRFCIRTIRTGKAATCGQLVMVILVLLAPDVNRLYGSLGSRLAEIAGWVVVGISFLAVINYTRLALRFLAVEQKPLEDEGDNEAKHGFD